MRKMHPMGIGSAGASRAHLILVLMVALTACKGKKNDAPAAGSGSAAKTVDQKPVTCPPGNVVKDGACVVAVTAEKVAVVAQQQSRIDEMAKLLDNVETVAAPVELMNSFKQTPEWQTLVGRVPKLKSLEDTVTTLDGAVKQLRTFKGNLSEASARLGNLKGELDRLMTDTGAARQLDEVRARVSSELRSTFEPLGNQVSETIQKAITPLTTKLEEASDMIIGTCLIAKSQSGDKVKSLCADAKVLFEKANTYVADLKQRPAKLFDEVTSKLETELELLVDAEAKKLLDAAQTQVNAALNLPPAPVGSAAAGSAVTGSGSATK